MVRLTRIYTKTGDKGTTALGSGKRVRKDHPRIEACGDVDELNAVLGLVVAGGLDGEASDLLRSVQNDLFDLGADLTVPAARVSGRAPLRVTPDYIAPLEAAIDRHNAALSPLRSFVLPGGTTASAWLHLARTVCRRAERRLVALSRREAVNPHAIIYLNRLSDLLFVLARRANDGGKSEPLWQPGGRRTGGRA
ncbi:MAG TPA: cob(I)yrinic acid a,c-diamide adenosyltransferase [Candidatus Cryosericum sp.]|nr:cob(I)yrinic acid a,c-diamide adenosyltransferase [Candidatus Cryosericum sp.]